MLDNFPTCLDFTLTQEGGFVDNPLDSGRATNLGITAETLSNWLGRGVSTQDIKTLPRSVAGQIYRRDYWGAVSGDGLPSGVDLMTFDHAVNTGPGTSVRLLQRLLKLPQDGAVGPVTLGSIRAHDPHWVVAMLAVAQGDYYRGLAGFDVFGAGWVSRVNRRRDAALGMVAVAA
jgi:lysozyme family protein